MASITRYIPPLLEDVYTPEICEFITQDELLEIPFVKTFRIDSKGYTDRYFYRYSLDGKKLMVESRRGFSFCVGSIKGKHNLTLPKWVSNEATEKCQDSVDITQ
jgi:hypothetical protein